jgi:hypothetical protein
VGDLKNWDLPRLEDLEDKLRVEFGKFAGGSFKDREQSDEQLQRMFLDRLRELATVAVNETIEYWVKGLTDGCNGRFPELCVELPYLEREENTEALTLAYCVDNEDGTRTELNRVSLERVLSRIIEEDCEGRASLPTQLKVVASELRTLAAMLERAAQR